MCSEIVALLLKLHRYLATIVKWTQADMGIALLLVYDTIDVLGDVNRQANNLSVKCNERLVEFRISQIAIPFDGSVTPAYDVAIAAHECAENISARMGASEALLTWQTVRDTLPKNDDWARIASMSTDIPDRRFVARLAETIFQSLNHPRGDATYGGRVVHVPSLLVERAC